MGSTVGKTPTEAPAPYGSNSSGLGTTLDINATVDVLPPIACHGVTRDSMFGLQHMRNSTVNARYSRFILVQTLDR